MKQFVRQIELAFRHLFVYPVLRLVWKNPPVRKPLDIGRVKKLLILRYDRIGDIVVTTPIIRALKKANPDLYLGVLASESNAELIRANPYVDRIHVLRSSWWGLWKEIRSARSVQYDVVLNLIFNRTTSGGVLANLIAPDGVKIGQGEEKYRFYFNVLLKLDRGQKHMAELLASIVRDAFGVTMRTRDIKFEIAVDADSNNKVKEFIGRTRKKRGGLVVVNISATDEVRRISDDQARCIVRSIVEKTANDVVVICAPQEMKRRDEVVASSGSSRCRAYPEGRVGSLTEVAALIGMADAVVTPDTSIVHIASAMKTPVIGLFTPQQMAAEWLPYNVTHETVFSPDKTPVSAIPLSVIEREVVGFIKKVVKL